jgi:Ran-binding protein 1
LFILCGSILKKKQQEVVYCKRSKLFIFGETLLDKGTGNKTWRERGVGEVRLLKHREHERIRLLMRQEKTHKVIANHVLDPRIVLKPNSGSDRSWVWSAYDFAEGELVETVFALRFADSDVAKEFYDAFVAAQESMKKLLEGADNPDAAEVGDEAAAAIAALSTKEESEEKLQQEAE